MKKYYIFDLDGTLADSMSHWRALVKLYPEIVGTPQQPGTALWDNAFSKMQEHYGSDITLKDGVIQMLKRAKSAGKECCIASATHRAIAEPLLKKYNLMDYMEFYISCTDVGAGKNKPDIYLQAAKRLGAEVSECAVFEDVPKAAQTARNAGFTVVGVYDRTTVTDGDLPPLCDLYLNSFTEFLGV